MKSIFSKIRNRKHAGVTKVNETETVATASGSHSGHSSSSGPSSSRIEINESNDVDLPFAVSTTPKTPQMDLIELMTDYMNRQDMAYFDLYHLGTKVNFDDMSLDMPVYHDVIRKVFASFPDLHFNIDHIQQTENEQVVKLIVTVTGTHTGVPYRTPVMTEVIPTSNVRVKLDPEEWTMTLSGMKISEFRVHSLGKYTGPNGLYLKVQKALRKRERKQRRGH